jgi:hypothetical protein
MARLLELDGMKSNKDAGVENGKEGAAEARGAAASRGSL